MRDRLLLLVIALVTLLSGWVVVARAQLSPDVAALLPDRGEGETLRRYVGAFGGGDLATVLVRGDQPDDVESAARDASERLRSVPQVQAALDHVSLQPPDDPTLAWGWADIDARRRLAQALTPEGMRERLRDTRALLLGPGAGAMVESIRLDPLRLAQIPFERPVNLAAGAETGDSEPGGPAGGGWAADDGKARLVLVAPRGQALRGADAKAFVDSVRGVLAEVAGAHPGVRLDLAGGHAVAVASEQMIRRDLQVSAVVATLAVAAMFLITFRRGRALLSILPPLAIGTLWTTAAGVLVNPRLSSIAVAFVSVVVGVGLDTGVHVYAAVMDARARGIPPREAGIAARKATWRPTLTAAVVAAAAFGSLGLSRIPALRQLGMLCAAGEVLTAIAILAISPPIGAWLERGAVPAQKESLVASVLRRFARLRLAPAVVIVAALIPAATLGIAGMPRLQGAVVAIRPSALEPIRVQEEIFRLFGGEPGQNVVLVRGESEAEVRAKADALSEKLRSARDLVREVDSVSQFAPSVECQKARLAERDRLELPVKAAALREALEAEGFAPDAFEPALEKMKRPSDQVRDVLSEPGEQSALLRARFLARDSGGWLAALYVRGASGRENAVGELVRQAEPQAAWTGYGRLESSLRETLASDLPRVGGVALGLVVLVMALALRKARDLWTSMLCLGLELLWVVAAIRVFGLRLHAYDALVLPVLLGVTIDEAMFLLMGSGQEVSRGVRSVVSTALTTAAGFAALGACRFEGLRDIGWLGLVGVVAGLGAVLLVVPAMKKEAVGEG